MFKNIKAFCYSGLEYRLYDMSRQSLKFLTNYNQVWLYFKSSSSNLLSTPTNKGSPFQLNLLNNHGKSIVSTDYQPFGDNLCT